MRQAVTQAKKANRNCPAPYYSLVYNAPVWYRRSNGILGADHHLYDRQHGLLGGTTPVVPAHAGVTTDIHRESWLVSLLNRLTEFLKRIFHRS